jgi:CheY-like chemotaxis protein
LKRLLEKNGYQVVTAETGKKGLQQLRNSSFDAALMDTELPDIELTDRIFQMYKIAPKMVKIISKRLSKFEKISKTLIVSTTFFLKKPCILQDVS